MFQIVPKRCHDDSRLVDYLRTDTVYCAVAQLSADRGSSKKLRSHNGHTAMSGHGRGASAVGPPLLPGCGGRLLPPQPQPPPVLSPLQQQQLPLPLLPPLLPLLAPPSPPHRVASQKMHKAFIVENSNDIIVLSSVFLLKPSPVPGLPLYRVCLPER